MSPPAVGESFHLKISKVIPQWSAQSRKHLTETPFPETADAAEVTEPLPPPRGPISGVLDVVRALSKALCVMVV